MRYRIVAILLLITVISSSFSRLCIYAGFEFNKSYIVKELCENRSRPAMHCDGKCYLMKKIKAAEEKEKKRELKDNLNRLEISFFLNPFEASFNKMVTLELNILPIPNYACLYTNQHTNTIFIPPKQVA